VSGRVVASKKISEQSHEFKKMCGDGLVAARGGLRGRERHNDGNVVRFTRAIWGSVALIPFF